MKFIPPLLMMILAVGCLSSRENADRKIELDLSIYNAEGLAGPPDGLVAGSYEFSIPDTPECRAEVRAIDSSVQFMPGSRGRVGAGKGECLCIGATQQRDWRGVLRRLAALPYVKRIIRCDFE